ncbi:MAG: response regulator [Cyanobacteria bacterium P01_C01_bin.89]
MGLNLRQRTARLVRRLPLRVVSIVPFIVQIAGAVSIVGYLSFTNSQETVRDLSDRLSKKVGDQIDQRLEDYLALPHIMQRSIAQDIAGGNLSLGNFDGLQRRFWGDVDIVPGVDYFFIGTEEGEFLGVQTYPNNGDTVVKFRTEETAPEREIYELDQFGVRQELLKSTEYDPRGRPWYSGAKELGKQTWSPVYPSADLGALQITPTTPLYDDEGQFLGVLGTNLILSEIDGDLGALDIGKSGEAYILERDGNVVASSTDEKPFILQGEDKEPERLNLSQSEDQYLRGAIAALAKEQQLEKTPKAKAETQSAGNSSRNGRRTRNDATGNNFTDVEPGAVLQELSQPTLVSLKVDGERVRAWMAPLSQVEGLDWVVVVVIPEADFMAAINQSNQVTIALSFVAVLLAIGAGWQTSRWVTEPIAKLNQSAKRLSDGNWDETISLDREDEVGELANSFNSMAVQLRQSFESLEEQNEELKRLDQLKDEFLANTSHELRTPLNGIIGITEFMLEGATGKLEEVQERNLWIVARSARRLANLVNDILDFSKLNHKTIQLNCKAINVAAIADIVIEVSQVLIGARDLTVENQVPLDLPAVWADESRLQQIFYNLVGNGVKFTEKGEVTVTAQFIPIEEVVVKEGESTGLEESYCQEINDTGAIVTGAIQVDIVDTGIGISDQQKERIFEAFEQGDGSTARRFGGTGLGLAVTKQLISLHGGNIWVESTPEVGSRFSFTLPAVEQQANPSHSSRDQALTRRVNAPLAPQTLSVFNDDSGAENADSSVGEMVQKNGADIAVGDVKADGEIRILVVDDEPVNLQVLENYLAFNGYEVTLATEGDEAIEKIEASDRGFDLVLLDVMMPKLSGYEACKHIRERFGPQELPIIMLTAKSRISDLMSAFQCGASDYLTKPFIKDELLARIKTHVRLARINNSYQRFVPSEYLKFLSRESITDVKLGDHVSREMAVMFSDIRSFTPRAELMTPDESFRFINEYLGRVSPEIRRNNGVIIKYMGDGVMAIFPKSADDAVRAAIAELYKVDEYNTHLTEEKETPISIGLGLHFGHMMVGIVGEAGRMQGDALSDTVNLTARIEGLTKYYGVTLLVSQQILDNLENPEEFELRLLDRVVVKGRSEPISIYEVVDGELDPKVRQLKIDLRADFDNAVALYQDQQWATALSKFSEINIKNPDDKPVQVYIQRLGELFQTPVSTSWDGVWRFKTK